MSDMKLVCRDCRVSFVFNDKEQNFLRQRFGNQFQVPVRCTSCRRQRRKGMPQAAPVSNTDSYESGKEYDYVWYTE
jgi:hypothetical protein